MVLRSDNGETWREHTLESNEEAIQDVLNHSFEGDGIVYIISNKSIFSCLYFRFKPN